MVHIGRPKPSSDTNRDIGVSASARAGELSRVEGSIGRADHFGTPAADPSAFADGAAQPSHLARAAVLRAQLPALAAELAEVRAHVRSMADASADADLVTSAAGRRYAEACHQAARLRTRFADLVREAEGFEAQALLAGDRIEVSGRLWDVSAFVQGRVLWRERGDGAGPYYTLLECREDRLVEAVAGHWSRWRARHGIPESAPALYVTGGGR
jgi:cell pole-organizing protein PopZ